LSGNPEAKSNQQLAKQNIVHEIVKADLRLFSGVCFTQLFFTRIVP
jgi:hypothetical protein